MDELSSIDDTSCHGFALRHSLPRWVVETVVEDWGQDGYAELAAMDQAADSGVTTMRFNPLKSLDHRGAEVPRETVHDGRMRKLASLVDEAVFIDGATARSSHMVESGLLFPQSLASMLVGRVANPKPGDRVLDMCAAPGGKTSHLAAQMNNIGELIANELHESRSRSLSKVLDRLGVTCATVTVGDARKISLGNESPFDLVLLDVPCSGSGVMGARPDIRWRINRTSLEGLVEVQSGLLDNAMKLVKPGGRVVYSTCSIFKREGENIVEMLRGGEIAGADQIERICEARTWPKQHGTEGFYVAQIQTGKSAAR